MAVKGQNVQVKQSFACCSRKSDDAVYLREYNSNFNYVFEENLQNCNELRLPRDRICPAQNAHLIQHFSAVG